MKVVITGGTGFIGLALARRLIERGTLVGPTGVAQEIDAIVLFDAITPAETPTGLDGRVSIVSGEIADRDTVFSLVDRDDTSVFHFASVVSGGGELDFDLAMSVNLDGGRNILEACRARAGTPRVVFASSLASFGSAAMPDTVTDTTKQTPQTTYGMTKAIGELMINDYTRKGFIDGRSARLPTIVIRPGAPNAAASSFASGVFREPLNGDACVLPVPLETRMPVLGHRNCVAGFIALHDADGQSIGDDRAINLPSVTYSVGEMAAAVDRVATARGRDLGPITVETDSAIEAIVATWPAETGWQRARDLGLPADESLDRVIEDYIDDYLD